jgi:Arc/MetJ family transcription regulator
MGITPEAMLELQTQKVKINVDDDLRTGAIAAYRAMQKAKMQQRR